MCTSLRDIHFGQFKELWYHQALKFVYHMLIYMHRYSLAHLNLGLSWDHCLPMSSGSLLAWNLFWRNTTPPRHCVTWHRCFWYFEWMASTASWWAASLILLHFLVNSFKSETKKSKSHCVSLYLVHSSRYSTPIMLACGSAFWTLDTGTLLQAGL